MKTDLIFAHAVARISELLVLTTGAEPHALDVSRLRWVIESRCRASRLDDAAAYAERVMSSPEELNALIDASVVPETRFFRDSRVFKHLRQGLPEMAADFPGALHILSAPCSTGQEAYSIAAMLQLSGITPARFSIDAVDISEAALKRPAAAFTLNRPCAISSAICRRPAASSKQNSGRCTMPSKNASALSGKILPSPARSKLRNSKPKESIIDTLPQPLHLSEPQGPRRARAVSCVGACTRRQVDYWHRG